MRKFSFYFSLIIARFAFLFLKITKLSSGTAFIGLIVLKICPDFLKYANEYSSIKINVTGTNGKTTTSNLLAHILKKTNHSIIYNSTGANMLNGIVNSLSLQINPFKKADYSIIETDEAFLDKVYESYDANYLIITNLFEDQLDRYGSINRTKQLIQNAINRKPNLQLVINADDPFLSDIKSNCKNAIYFGVEEVLYDNNITTQQKENSKQLCQCNKELNYTKRFYSKIGHYNCECGFTRPTPKYNAKIKLYSNHCVININETNYDLPLMGLFNAYNAVGTIAMCLELGIASDEIQHSVTDYKVFGGRCEYKLLNGHKTLIQLIKNPVGATEVLKTVDLNSNIFIAINDNAADGRDSSWINDANFEILKDAKKEIVVSGLRANEMAERLNKAGCQQLKVISNVKNAIDYISKTADTNITILPSYTVLQQLDKMKGFKKCY